MRNQGNAEFKERSYFNCTCLLVPLRYHEVRSHPPPMPAASHLQELEDQE